MRDRLRCSHDIFATRYFAAKVLRRCIVGARVRRRGEHHIAMTSSSTTSGTRILLVDDDMDELELLGQLLRNAGHEVDMASDAEKALQMLEAFQPHVAIIDIGLPDLDGYELARRMRERAPCRLFALSGYGANTAPADNVVTSFDRHFVKPVALPLLLAAIRDMPGR